MRHKLPLILVLVVFSAIGFVQARNHGYFATTGHDYRVIWSKSDQPIEIVVGACQFFTSSDVCAEPDVVAMPMRYFSFISERQTSQVPERLTALYYLTLTCNPACKHQLSTSSNGPIGDGLLYPERLNERQFSVVERMYFVTDVAASPFMHVEHPLDRITCPQDEGDESCRTGLRIPRTTADGQDQRYYLLSYMVWWGEGDIEPADHLQLAWGIAREMCHHLSACDLDALRASLLE